VDELVYFSKYSNWKIEAMKDIHVKQFLPFNGTIDYSHPVFASMMEA
jgi:hypothetical protein